MLDSTVINLVRENIFSFVDGFFNPYFRWCWVYFVVFPFYALIPYYRNLSPSEFNFREFINYCFPKEIYFSQTTKVNFGLFFLMKIVFPTSFMYRFISVGGISLYVYELLNGIVSPFWARFDSSGMTIFLFSAFMFVSVDFSNFFVHYLSHKIKWAWEFHSVHHSGDSLTPLSLFRFHPIFNFLRFTALLITFGIVKGVIAYITFQDLNHMAYLHFEFGFFLLHFLGSNFQHSHMWVSFGSLFNKILISPAHHQIHHSNKEIHRDKNFGEFLCLWDYLFGTLYIPQKKEDIVFGIQEGRQNYHPTVWKAFSDPFILNFKKMIKYFGANKLVTKYDN